MKFNIIYGRNFNSIKKAIRVYFQLIGGDVCGKDILFNSAEKVNMTFDCSTVGNTIIAKWANNRLPVDYKKVLKTFFIEAGYKDRIILNPKYRA